MLCLNISDITITTVRSVDYRCINPDIPIYRKVM